MSQQANSESYENEPGRSINLMQFLLEDMALSIKNIKNIQCGLWARHKSHSLIYFKWFVGFEPYEWVTPVSVVN